MPSLTLMKHLIREVISRKDAYRVPEPDLIMDGAEQVSAFHEAGADTGVMAPVYLYHAAQICEVIKPGETVLDLGCGPANQLGLVARLNPDVRFVGVDLSDEMLLRARRNLELAGVGNVELMHADITDLRGFSPSSVDAVMSTVVLHHLPDEAALFRCFQEVQRVLRPGGGLYLVDFGHLRTEAAIRYFAYQYEASQPRLFTIDYLNSLRAAFEVSTWRDGHARHLSGLGQFYSTFIVPYMVAVRSGSRRQLPEPLIARLRERRAALSENQARDLSDLITFFRLGGLAVSGF